MILSESLIVIAEIFDALSKHLGLRFVYEEKHVTPSTVPEIQLRPEQLAVLPSDLIQQLHQATIELNMERIDLLLEKIIQLNSPIGKVLQDFVKKFEYEHLLKILDEYAKIAGGSNDRK